MIVGGGKDGSGRRKPSVRLDPKDDRSGIVVGRKSLPTIAPRKIRLPAPAAENAVVVENSAVTETGGAETPPDDAAGATGAVMNRRGPEQSASPTDPTS
jgi:hypothetical protein